MKHVKSVNEFFFFSNKKNNLEVKMDEKDWVLFDEREPDPNNLMQEEWFPEDDEWRRNTDDTDLKDLSYEVDDILLDISDEGFPYVQPSLINYGRINIEITGTEDGTITENNEFCITEVIQNTLRRLYDHVKSRGYKCYIGLYFYSSGGFNKSYEVRLEGDKWYITKEIDDNLNQVEPNNKQIDLLRIEPDFIGITIRK